MYAKPTDAATVMVIREERTGREKDIEVLMVLRNRSSRFVPGYHVYPGGILDPEDYAPGVERFCTGMDRKKALEILPNMSKPEKAIGAWVAGIRETFEEAGILIASRRDGTRVSIRTDEDKKRLCGYRRALNGGEMKFPEILEKEDLVLPLDRLHYFSHWITPEPLPLRYDVRFFLAETPERQEVMHDGLELTEHLWVSPGKALELYEKGEFGMVLPQIMTLVELSQFRTVEDAIRSTKGKKVPANLTKIKKIEGHDVEVMPDGSAFKGRLPVYKWINKNNE
jgi:8-oxo-dGTP pyrophosphatase MutT (NUDIX family)